VTKTDGSEQRDQPPLSSRKILSLIHEERYDEARLLIDAERERLPEEAHRLTALSARIYEHLGKIVESIALLRQAIQEKPTWLPHLYQLSVLLMDAKHWNEADVVLGEIIALSLAKDDVYFLGDCRFRKAVCLKRLGRVDELKQVIATIPVELSVFIGDKLCRIDDIRP
jgi:tetratricopeptide (TPR) repeat protein